MTELVFTKINDFKTIALAVDFSKTDEVIFQYALKLAEPHTSFVLIHITESASPQLMGSEAKDFEIREDKEIIESYIKLLEEHGYSAVFSMGYKNRNREIARICRDEHADLLIMGSHGHKGLKDLIFGETVNKVRHLVKIPVFVAQ